MPPWVGGSYQSLEPRAVREKEYIQYRSPSEYNGIWWMWLFHESVQIPSDFTNNTLWNEIPTDTSCSVHVGIQGHILVKTPDKPSLFPRARQTQVLRCFSDGGHWRPHAQPAQHVGMTDAQICLLHVSLRADEGVIINHHLEGKPCGLGHVLRWCSVVVPLLWLSLSLIIYSTEIPTSFEGSLTPFSLIVICSKATWIVLFRWHKNNVEQCWKNYVQMWMLLVWLSLTG